MLPLRLFVCMIAAVSAAPVLSAPYLEGIKPSEAEHVLKLLQSAQESYVGGTRQHFEISFGTSVSDPTVTRSPDDVFKGLNFHEPFSVKRLKGSATANYQLVFLPNGPGPAATTWDVRLRVGAGDRIDAVDIRKGIAAPY